MKKRTRHSDLLILGIAFIASRLVIHAAGTRFGASALFEYWQYLDVRSLKSNLFNSLWYQHSQPPLFNLLLGIGLKMSGQAWPLVFQTLFLVISFVNFWLIFATTKTLVPQGPLPRILALVYLLSPATLLYENELFYTLFISLLLLLVVYLLISARAGYVYPVVFVPLTMLCLTKSSYHLAWLALVSIYLLYNQRYKPGFRRLAGAAVLSMALVGGWYAKNYVVFDKFAGSSWLGINLSRIVFRDAQVSDSASIAAIHPFYPVKYYQRYISTNYQKFSGLNDQVLLSETKQGNYVNMNHAAYLEVSDKYLDASLKHIAAYPAQYVKNAATSALIFFTPASSYFKLATNANTIRYYDVMAGLNLSHLFTEKKQQKQALALVAILIGVVYGCLVVTGLVYSRQRPAAFVGFILLTFAFTFMTGSLLEYGENMRFRFELHPMFLVLAALVPGLNKRWHTF